jgi:hypothetical protein
MIEKKKQNKSPYVVLGIRKKVIDHKEEENDSNKSYEQIVSENKKRQKEQEAYDQKIKEQTKKLLIFKLGDIKRALKSNPGILEDEETLHNHILSIITMLKSYVVISTDEQRALFECSGITNIEDEAKSILDSMEHLTLRKGKNAFEVNKMQPVTIGKISNSNTRAKDREIRDNFKSHVSKLLSEIPDHDQIGSTIDKITMSKILDTIYRMEEQFWAYSKINTENKRQQYMRSILMEAKRKYYKELADDVKSRKIKIRTDENGPRCRRVKGERPRTFTINKGESVTIQLIGKMNYEIFILPEDDLGIYKITKSNGIKTYAFSPVHLDWITQRTLKDSITIREGVAELLSDASLKFSHEYLGGYLGVIPSEGIKESDRQKIYEDISACRVMQKKINERGKKQTKKGNEQKSKKTEGDKANERKEEDKTKAGLDFLDR